MLQAVVQWAYGRLFPRRLKNALAFALSDVERSAPPRVLAAPPGSRVLVLAPHADDETIGCGGTLCKYVRAGAEVHVAFLTDGALGDRALRQLSGSDPRRERLSHELVARRREEATAALSTLGVTRFSFLDGADGNLGSRNAQVVQALAQLIDAFQPDVVLLPFLTDRHPDHVAATACLLASLDACTKPTGELQLGGYEVWTPIYANAVVDISDVLETKRSALRAYQSQLKDTDYEAGIFGLNRYRAISALQGIGYCEAFYFAPLSAYRRIYARMRL